jgi:hypothetical protein
MRPTVPVRLLPAASLTLEFRSWIDPSSIPRQTKLPAIETSEAQLDVDDEGANPDDTDAADDDDVDVVVLSLPVLENRLGRLANLRALQCSSTHNENTKLGGWVDTQGRQYSCD